jgi:maleate isomerase
MADKTATAASAIADPEYGPVFAVLTPQANTTVEPEMQMLLPGTVLTARCTGTSHDSRQRLIDYIERLDSTLACFDSAPIRVAGFACTGSNYLVGLAEEERRLQTTSLEKGFPVISATQAIRQCLDVLGAKKIALLSPYPDWLTDAASHYWRSAGYTITAITGLPAESPDTRSIYKLTSGRVVEAIRKVDTKGCDAVLLSGTGMPSLHTLMANPLASDNPGTVVPALLSSNLCLAWAMQSAVKPALATRTALLEFMGSQADWRKRLTRRKSGL